jgi:hypothetical protein
MLSKIRRHLSFANVVSVIALFVALGGVAYAAGTIGSADVINNSLLSADLKDNQVKSVDVRDDSLAGGGLTGTDIVESSLGQVPSATLGGFGRESPVGSGCDPEDSAFINCAATDFINLPAPTRVLIIGQVTAYPEAFGSSGSGFCHVGLNTGALPSSQIHAFVKEQDDALAMSGVTSVVGPGLIAVGLDCNENAGGISYTGAHLSFVELSPG